MRNTVFVLAAFLLVTLAASAACAEDAALRRSPTEQGEAPWVVCAEGDYVRSYAPQLKTAPQKRWGGAVAAYLWATDIRGTSYADGVPTDIDIDFSDLFDKLESSFMGYAEVHYDRWSFAVDASLVNLSEAWTGQRGVPVEAEIDQTILDLRLGYNVLCRQVGSAQWGSCCYARHMTLDAVVGARYWNLEQRLSTTSIQTGAPLNESQDESWWDPYVGARFRWQFAKRWGLTVYGDVGGFDIEGASKLTWQVQTMLRFNITRGLFVAVGYRALGVDRVEGSGATQNGIDATYHGPLLGFGYAF